METPSSNQTKTQTDAGPDDIELVKRCQRGDLAAYEVLVERYRQRVFNVAYGIVHNVEDANDLCQEAFVKAWRSLRRFKGKSAFYTWIYRITTNLGIDHLRRKAKHGTVAFDEAIKTEEETGVDAMATNTALPSKETERSELREAIEDALEKLSPEHRTVIVLKEYEGLAYKEIAKIVGCSLGTVMSRLFYARKHLQKLLKDMR